MAQWWSDSPSTYPHKIKLEVEGHGTWHRKQDVYHLRPVWDFVLFEARLHYVALAGLEILLLLLPKVLRLKAATMSGLTSLKQGKVTDPDINYQGVTVTMSRTEQEDQRGRGTQG